MNKFKLLAENFLVYGLGSIISKIVPFLLLPIITRLLPDTYYFGLNDLSVSIVSFAQAFAVLGMYDAMFRMFFEKADQHFKKEICSTAFLFTFINSSIVFILMILFRDELSHIFFNTSQYKNLIIICAVNVLLGATNTIISAPTRMQNQRKVFLITNTLSSLLSYSLAIPLLVHKFYVMALPLASILSALLLTLFFGVLNHSWFSIQYFNASYLKQMFVIALPLVPNFLIYWIFNSGDRVMISKMMGTDWNGIYAVGAKIGSISYLIYSAFSGGWQYFAFSTMKEKKQVSLISNIFEYLGIISFSVGLLICVINQQTISLLFDERYLNAAVIVPYLFISPLFLMLFQIASSQFIIIKTTWPNPIILGFGAIINIFLNWILIPVLGIEGASIGTLGGYLVSVISILILLKKKNLITISRRFCLCTAIFFIDFIIWRLVLESKTTIMLLLTIVTILVYAMIYFRDLKGLIVSFRK